ncbi:C-type lectin domain family 4 member M-like isoform X2 [Pristis pectinata]|uniref:C-type lectin domain family 4 member M-like isoform X2 n=1 Tax=Pristis pectinata TaxID=685728 RepID=UPI00223CAE50|nr:C-type lectin domain family 4 member M-like isoform X2 [Pristis pectinata]
MDLANSAKNAQQNLSISDNENSELFKDDSKWTRLTKLKQEERTVRVILTLCLIFLGALTVLSVIAYLEFSVAIKELQDSVKNITGSSTHPGNEAQVGYAERFDYSKSEQERKTSAIRISKELSELKESVKQLNTELQQLQGQKMKDNMKQLQDSQRQIFSDLQNLKDLQISDQINQLQTLMDTLNVSTHFDLQSLKQQGQKMKDNMKQLQDSQRQIFSDLQNLKDLQISDQINQLQTLMDTLNVSTHFDLQGLKQQDLQISDEMNQLQESDKHLNSELQQLKVKNAKDDEKDSFASITLVSEELSLVKEDGQKMKENMKQLQDSQRQILSDLQNLKDLQTTDQINQLQTAMDILNMSTHLDLQSLKQEGLQISEEMYQLQESDKRLSSELQQLKGQNPESLQNSQKKILTDQQNLKDLQLGDHIGQMQTLMDTLNMSTLSELQNLKQEGFQFSENLKVITGSITNVNVSLLSRLQRMEQNAVTVLTNIQTMQDSLSRLRVNVQTLKATDKQFSEDQKQSSNSTELFKNSFSSQLQNVKSLVSSLSDKMLKLEESNSNLRGMLQSKVRNHCPEHWMLYAGRCYLFSLTEETFTNAKRQCALKQSHLVGINSKAEQKFIADHTYSKFYWIGLTDSLQEGDWIWEDGTSYSSSPKFWKPGQPDNHNKMEHCAHLVARGLWNDGPCSRKYKYICEKMPD